MYVNRQSAKSSQQEVKLRQNVLITNSVLRSQLNEQIVEFVPLLDRQGSTQRQGFDALNTVGLGRPPGADENKHNPTIASLFRLVGEKPAQTPENRAGEMSKCNIPVKATSFLKPSPKLQESLNKTDENPDATSETKPPLTDLHTFQDAHNISSTNYACSKNVLKGFDFLNREKLKFCPHSTRKSVPYEKTTLLSHLSDLGSSTPVRKKLYSRAVGNEGLEDRSPGLCEVESDLQGVMGLSSQHLNYKSAFKERLYKQKHGSLDSLNNPIAFLHSLSPTIHPLSNGINEQEFFVCPCRRNNTRENLGEQEELEVGPVQVSENHLPLEESDPDVFLAINPGNHQFPIAQEELRK